MSELVLEYAELIGDFLESRISVNQFEKFYFAKFKSEPRRMTDLEYDVLNSVFTDLDCFNQDGLVSNGPSLNEIELRQSMSDRYVMLRSIGLN